jgi:hypothetical protein
MNKIILFLIILLTIPFEKIFLPNIKHALSFFLLLILNWELSPFPLFLSSFIYSVSLESFNPYKIWLMPFYFSILSFILIWFKKNINYKISIILFTFSFFLSFIFFSLISPSISNFLNSFILSFFLILLFKLWKKE